VKIFEFLVSLGYVGGVFIALPLLLYTLYNEKLHVPGAGEQAEYDSSISEEERNRIAGQVLMQIENRMDTRIGEDGLAYVTINSGRQAKDLKHGLDYINKRLAPTNPHIIDRVHELSDVYRLRTRRYFTGSYILIVIASGFGVYLWTTPGNITFNLLHVLGVVLYALASRTPAYVIDKRMSTYGESSSFISEIFSGLFIGSSTKHYVKYGDGAWQRDGESEFSEGLVFILIMFVVILFLAILTAFFGLISFIMNYSTSFLHPLQNERTWFDKNFPKAETI